MSLGHKGFSLLEVLFVVALIGLLSHIALPRYEAQVQRTHRTQFQQHLLALSQRLAHQHSLSGSFAIGPNAQQEPINDDWLGQQGWDRWPVQATDKEQRYQIRFVDGAPLAEGYTLMAEPMGAQSSDACGVLLLDHRQTRGALGVLDSRSEPARRCWGR